MSSKKYVGSDPNELKFLISSDPESNSELLIASTKCVYEALHGIQAMSVPPLEGNQNKFLMTDGLKLFWDWGGAIFG